MASSENIQSSSSPWNFLSAVAADSWISEAFSRETQTFTKSLSNPLTSDSITPFLNLITTPETSPAPTVYNAELVPNHRRIAIPTSSSSSGKVRKRKSRTSSPKKCQTTFIGADAANFRRMVQQVTGASRLGNSPVVEIPALSLDQHQQRVVGSGAGEGSLCFQSPAVVVDGGATAFEFDGFSCFPTLESWKVVLE